MATLEPGTGARGPARNADLREGTRLLADRDHVTGTGAEHVETWRSDLVLTTEVGRVETPVQPPDAQPRAGCTNGSVAVGGGTVGMVQRCPGRTPTGSPSSTPTPKLGEARGALQHAARRPGAPASWR